MAVSLISGLRHNSSSGPDVGLRIGRDFPVGFQDSPRTTLSESPTGSDERGDGDGDAEQQDGGALGGHSGARTAGDVNLVRHAARLACYCVVG